MSAFCWNNNCIIVNTHGRTTIKNTVYNSYNTVQVSPTEQGQPQKLHRKCDICAVIYEKVHENQGSSTTFKTNKQVQV
jgi:hypothetical protein